MAERRTLMLPALLAVAALAGGCASDGDSARRSALPESTSATSSPGVSSSGGAAARPTPTLTTSVQDMATGRALAAIALDHLDPAQVDSVAGLTYANGAMARIALASGPGDALYVNTASPEGSPPGGRCPGIGQEVSGTFIVSWCEADAESVTEVARSEPDKRPQVVGFRQGRDGLTTVSVDPATDIAAAEELVREILLDPRLRFVTTPEVIASGAALDGYADFGAN